METLIVDRIQSSLRHFMYKNAIFLSERLCAEFPSELNLQLMAGCYLRNNQAYSAYYILKGKQMPQSRYLFALSCFRMNLLREAEAALCSVNEPNSEVPNGAAGHYLLGLVYRYTSRRTHAVDHFMQALVIDPLLWAAYEELCMLGAAEEANEIFSDSTALRIQQLFSEPSSSSLNNANDERGFSFSRAKSSGDSSPMQSKQLYANNSSAFINNPSIGMVASQPSSSSFCSTPPILTQQSEVAPPPLFRNPYFDNNFCDGSAKQGAYSRGQVPRRKIIEGEKFRKVTGRLFSDSTFQRSSRHAGEAPSISNVFHIGGHGTNHHSTRSGGGSSSSPLKTHSVATRSSTIKKAQSLLHGGSDQGRRLEVFDEPREDDTTVSSSISALADFRFHEHSRGGSMHDPELIDGIRQLLALFRILGEAYRLSCMYRCKDALEAYRSLPQSQFNTGWVQSQVGKAYFELVDYFEADCHLHLARQLSPYILEEMDIYSTVLFHLREEMKLSYLSQELISTDRLSPQAWCAVGNCYSLQKDHETAVKIFQRAVHLESRFAYAHTLCGHEYAALEDYDSAIKCYQSALQVDERHYNSWYGLGLVYLRQEKFQFAEHHFRRALNINPCNSVLMCYLGMSLHSLKRCDEALDMMEKAILADPMNPLSLYQKASILASLGRYDEALEELERLTEFAPREPSVYALMGKIYKRLDNHDKAMSCFGYALDLKPPATDIATIKSAMEKLHLPDDLEDGF